MVCPARGTAMRRLMLALSILFIGIAVNRAAAEPIAGISLVPDVLDYGWTGFGHDRPLPGGTGTTLATLKRCSDTLSLCTSDTECAVGSCLSTCTLGDGICELSGPRGSRRCVRDMAPCNTNADCGSLGRCASFVAPPIAVSTSNTPVCITAFTDSDITGTYDPVTGDSALAMELRLRVYLGVDDDAPCPLCGAPDQNPEVGDTFTCTGGPKDGESCTVEGVTAVFGGVSSDCPPDITAHVSGTGLPMRLPEITTGTTHRDAQIPCMDGLYCHCGFCDDDPTQPCFSDGDCANGQTCSAGDSSSGVQEQPNGCEDLVCGRDEKERCCSNQCEDDQQPCDVNADCTSGPCIATAECPAPTPLRGECTLKRYVACSSDFECGFWDAGTCDLQKRPCFENRISRQGTPSPVGPITYVALACLGKTLSAGPNAGPGLPGPAAISFIGTGLDSITTTTITPTTTIVASSTTLPFTVCGDATGEGSITASDALSILKSAVGSGSCPHDRCDVNGDDELTASDALSVLRVAVGLSGDLTCGA